MMIDLKKRVYSHSRGHGRPRFSEAQTLPDRIKGNVIDTTSNDYATFVLTDKGEIAWSRDSIKWEVIDFNEAYRGYYQPVRFVGIAAGNGSVTSPMPRRITFLSGCAP